ncbi:MULTISPECIES: hypothetical protein [Pseudobutyrivibrio]|uniref:Uncharacterized protein n=1 Tax=Pseudobutyrivibrio ruminis TaxID=46206 RepID=A0A1H7L109_9FIRM|nr:MULTISPECIES: hypothetical protein [Pseudobutyrivibrio]SEK92672.1 hypothetical protein SAMN02910377_02209 [Pseudobutyrivibrio ruminis]SET19292.1 hypothetical protein SAMN02910413_2086 [Pseudobutyrivibrio sp. C4]
MNILSDLFTDIITIVIAIPLVFFFINTYIRFLTRVLGEAYIPAFMMLPGFIIFTPLSTLCLYISDGYFLLILIGVLFALLALAGLLMTIFFWPSEEKDTYLFNKYLGLYKFIKWGRQEAFGIDEYDYYIQDFFRNKLVIIKARKEYCFITWFGKKKYFKKEDVKRIDHWIGKNGSLYGKYVIWGHDEKKLASIDDSGFGDITRLYSELSGLQGIDYCTHLTKR